MKKRIPFALTLVSLSIITQATLATIDDDDDHKKTGFGKTATSSAQNDSIQALEVDTKFNFNQYLVVFWQVYESSDRDLELSQRAKDRLTGLMKQKGYRFVSNHTQYHNVLGRIMSKKFADEGNKTRIITKIELQFIKSTRMAAWQSPPKKYVRDMYVILDIARDKTIDNEHYGAEVDSFFEYIASIIPNSNYKPVDSHHCPYCAAEKDSGEKICLECDKKREHFSYLSKNNLPDTYYTSK